MACSVSQRYSSMEPHQPQSQSPPHGGIVLQLKLYQRCFKLRACAGARVAIAFASLCCRRCHRALLCLLQSLAASLGHIARRLGACICITARLRTSTSTIDIIYIMSMSMLMLNIRFYLLHLHLHAARSSCHSPQYPTYETAAASNARVYG